jgi:hypothetical protein
MKKLDFLRPVPLGKKIRVGRNWDGGYILYGPLLAETDALVSYGVGWEISFEEHFSRLTNKTVIMFDPTMFGKYLTDTKFVKTRLLELRLKPAFEHLCMVWRLYKARKKFIQRKIFFVNEGIAAAKSPKYDTFDHHIERYNLQDKQLLLKIDIEAAEYDIFKEGTIYRHLQQVNQIAIELHNLKNRLQEAKAIIMELKKTYLLVHIHPTNFGETFKIYDFETNGADDMIVPDVLELLFVRKDKVQKEDLLSGPIEYPMAGIDYPSNPRKEDIPVKFI